MLPSLVRAALIRRNAPHFVRYCSTRSSVNAEEVAKFDAQAGQWWDPSGVAYGLHRMNPTRLGVIRAAIERVVLLGPRSKEMSSLREQTANPRKPLAGVDIVDVGCGGGLTTEPLARLGGNVLGVDMSEVAIGVARAHASRDSQLATLGSPQYEQASVEDLVARDKRYDAVLALEIVEHVDEPAKFISDCSALVAPGGVFLLSTLNRTALSYALGIVAAERILGWLPPGTHDWNKFLSPEEVRTIIRERTDLLHEETVGIKYHPISRRFSVSQDTAINYILCAKRPAD